MKKSLFIPLLSSFLLLSSCSNYVNPNEATKKDYDYAVRIKINDASSYYKKSGNNFYKIGQDFSPKVDKDSVIKINLSKNNLVKKYLELNYQLLIFCINYLLFDFTVRRNEIKRIKKNISFDLKDHSEELESKAKKSVGEKDGKQVIYYEYPNVYFRLTVLYVNNEYGVYRFYAQINSTYKYTNEE